MELFNSYELFCLVMSDILNMVVYWSLVFLSVHFTIEKRKTVQFLWKYK